MSADDIIQPPTLNDPRYQQPEEDEGPQLIGRPPTGFTVERDVTETRGAPERGGLVEGQEPTTQATTRQTSRPQYFEGDEYGLFTGLSPEQIAAIQTELIRSGMVDAEDIRPGVWDPDSADAMKDVLEHANYSGLGWDEALVQLGTTPQGGAGGEGGRGLPEPYTPPDYATLAQGIKGWMRQQLGRDPRDHEITTLAQQAEQLYRADYDQQTQADEYQMQVEAGISEEEAAGAVGRDVDVKARFSEMMEERYANELRTVEAEDEAGRTQDIATGFGNLFRSMIGN